MELTEEENVIDHSFQIFLSAAAGQCGCAHGFCIGCQLFQCGFAGADLCTDTGVIGGIAFGNKAVNSAVFNDLCSLDQAQGKGIHAQNVGVEHILHGVGGTAVSESLPGDPLSGIPGLHPL